MARLSLSLLGPFRATLDGEPIAGFKTNKVRALLAYLVLEASQHPSGHPRTVLAGLLWPDKPERAALTNLRTALASLRLAIGDRAAIGDRDTAHAEGVTPPFLLITRETIQFNPASDHWLDVAAFGAAFQTLAETTASEADVAGQGVYQRLEEAVALYRGDLLEGFFVRDSPAFEDWVLPLRERLHWQALQALGALAAYHKERGAYGEAIASARRQVVLQPWQESAHRQMMRCLALSGQRSMALAQYATCREVLADELGVEPESATTALYEQIRTGVLAPKPPVGSMTSESRIEAAPLPAAIAAQKEAPLSSLSSFGQGIPEGERRVVTVVQAQVSGSTASLARVSTADWTAFVGQFLRTAKAEVHRLGGEVDRCDPQGLVALFGAQAAHEDDPERGVLAALAMQTVFRAQRAQRAQLAQRAGLAEGAAEWAAPGDPSLRVGVHTGEAIVTLVEGENGGGRRAVADETLVSASRVLALVPPGEVRVSETTHRLVEPLFEWGQGERSRCPLGHKAPLNKGRGIEGLEAPLVGRDAELRVLQEAVARLREGVGGIVTVVGEAGIGKSRLVAEIRDTETHKASRPNTRDGVQSTAIVTGDVQWVEGRCLSYSTGVAYSLWLDLLRELLGLDADAHPEAAAQTLCERVDALCRAQAGQVYPFLARMMSLPLTGSAADRLRGIEGEGLQVLTFRAVETLVECVTQRGALVLVCEDLHWADPASLSLLEHLLSLTDRVPLLVICVFRPKRDHVCWRIKETVDRFYGHRHTDLWLGPLSADASVQLIGSLLHTEDLPEALRSRILERAEGNPFYMEEILRSLIDGGAGGAAHDTPIGHWHEVRQVDELALPDTLRGVLMARIDHLPRGARQVLQLASVVGRNFTYPILSAIVSPPLPLSGQRGRSGGGESVLDAHLVVLQRAQIIRETSRVPEARYTFKHQLTLEAAYDSLPQRKRRVLHRRVAEVLEQLLPERGSPGRGEGQPSLLAYHWERSGKVERAIPYLRQAAERAAAQFANVEAVVYLSRALDLVPKESVERYALLLARERVSELLGDRRAQERDLTALDGWVEAYGAGAERAEAAVRWARYFHRIDENAKAASAAQRAVRCAQAARDVRSEAMAYREWGRALRGRDNRDERQQCLERALALARDAGLREIEAEILHTLGSVLFNYGNLERGLECWEQGLCISRQIGDRRCEGEALRDVGWALSLRGDWTKGEAYLRQSLNVCRETGNRRDEAWALHLLAPILYHQGHFVRARNDAEESLRICREVRDRPGERESLYDLGVIHTALADHATARDYLEQSLCVSRDMNSRFAEGYELAQLGLVFHLQGAYASAKTYYEQALHIGRENKDRWPVEARALIYSSLLSHHLGDNRSGREHGQQALLVIPSLDMIQAVELISVFVVLGHALAGLGHLAEAAEAYQQGLTLRRGKGQHHRAVEPLAGLARVALVQENAEEALAHVEEILDYMEDSPALAGTLEPLRIYLTCYSVLSANRDRRAKDSLEAAYQLLQERAATIEDEDLRCSYLLNVPAHREIVSLWEETSSQ